MSTLNRYVLNRACPEGSIIEAYCTEEVVECCKNYLVDKKGIGIVASHHMGRLAGKGTRVRRIILDNGYAEVLSAHVCVLHQTAMMADLIEEHLNIIHAQSNGHSEV